MAVTIGTQLGSHVVTALLGRGGMGEVYRARDSKLKREVAIKILPEEFNRDFERLARFQREAEVLASLNHPNIAAIYDLEEADSVRFLVLELVEGETLAERVRGGRIPIDEALKIAKSISEALEAAHEKGVVHRDLKPANVKIAPDSRVKVLDFGLAKVLQADAAAEFADSPTLLSGSALGMLMGTPAYMSPEQAKGKDADRTSDIWAFGCVFYEILTGRRAFQGETAAEILGDVLKTEPDWSRLPAETPVAIQRLLRQCLRKDRARRLHDIADARIEIEDARDESPSTVTTGHTAPWGYLTAIVLLAIIALGLAVLHFRQAPPAEAHELRLEITTPPTTDPYSLALSPDGRRIAFVASMDGKSMLFTRDLDSMIPHALPETDGASFPFWSPDSRSLGFFAEAKLKRIDIAGGLPQVLAPAPTARGGTWSPSGVIVFAPTVGGGLWRVAASGGETSQVLKVEAPIRSHRFPQFLPDGQHFLFFSQGNVYVGALDGSTPRSLLSADSAAVYQAAGYLLFSRQGTLFAQKFDPASFQVSGEPASVEQKVSADSSVYIAPLTTAAGAIAYRAGVTPARRLVWFDRRGKEVASVAERAGLNSPELSPDEKHVALQIPFNGNLQVWTIEIARGVATPLTSNSSNNFYPVWSREGKWIAFASQQRGPNDIFKKLSSGATPEELIVPSQPGVVNRAPMDWSSDDRFLLFREIDAKNGYELWAWPMSGEDRKPIPIASTPNEEPAGQFSPDVRWVAYSSNVSGRSEIWVQPFPGPGTRLPVSTGGGAQPRWSHDQKEIFYLAPDDSLMSVPLKFSGNGESLEPGAPVTLFQSRIFSSVLIGGKQQYAVSHDGQRFLAIVPPEEASPITILLNWRPPAQK